MTSAVLQAHVVHARLAPFRHVFCYRLDMLAVDLEDLPALGRRLPGGLLSIRQEDYLPGPGSLSDRVHRLLLEERLPGVRRVLLVTAPRFLGYVFNPVNVYYCYDGDGHCTAHIVEVNNTFGETHAYVLAATRQADKRFHVSPFNPLRGSYDFRLGDVRQGLDVHIDLDVDDRPLMRTRLWGQSKPLTRGRLLAMTMRYPFGTLWTMPRILWQAAQLYYRKGLPVFSKPAPPLHLTYRDPGPSLLQKMALRATLKLLSQTRRGGLCVTLPNGRVEHFGEAPPAPQADLRALSYDFFTDLLVGGEVAFGESYVNRCWDSQDLPGLLRHLVDNRSALQDGNTFTTVLGRALNRLVHLSRPNTVGGSQRNIQAHYDLSNDLFTRLLDQSMTYSCALFDSPDTTLEAAQRAKLRKMVDLARLRSHHHVLEIGCGWGSFALETARTVGCRVTGLTLSTQQLSLARDRVREAGLEHLVTLQLMDYRHVTGRFDRIVSIEMLEAIGHAQFPTFFRTCDRLLAENGLVALQVITIPEPRYEAYRKNCDFMQKHIFPGCLVPSFTALCQAMARHSDLLVESVDNLGPHYAPTLRHWRENLVRHAVDLRHLGFDDAFQRKWAYYLASCEVGFETRTLNDLHIVLTRAGNLDLRSDDNARGRS